ncbi:PREDICTED: putative clathrin assembly protein At1g14910 [Camelina sativa]|uniref:Clathrin assembly protein At1g14910 n=1 Tax=Camelina sativa TaxID=90675 RepID=A0ABM0Y795_CAMSA|nr:PREDICTED: putative clathrin assembly protein At1g14910 [Camelina sativa]
MATLQSWRRAYGALKDTTKVGLVRVNSDYAELDVAIVKATNHVECPPKDRHLKKIFLATSAVRPRADVAYCIHALSRRLHKTRNWTVALKALLVLHRLLRDGDPTFREELLNFSQKGRIMQISNFKDESSPTAWDCSGWVRAYALFLEERLECFRVLKYDMEAERLPKVSPGQEKGYSKTRDLDGEKLLEQLPALQQLLHRLIGCKPEGAAKHNRIIQYALALVLKESFKVYCAINEGIINLVEKFFEMPRHEAIKALDIYKRAGLQAGNLSAFYEVCKGLELARNFQFPVLREPPQSFLVTMEEYMRDAPQMVDVTSGPLLLTYTPDEGLDSEDVEPSHEGHEPPLPSDGTVVLSEGTQPSSQPPPSAETPRNIIDTDDLLGLNDDAPDPLAILDQNALALALVSTDDDFSTFGFGQARDLDSSGWELALVTTPSNDISAATERKLAGGLDTLTLNSLYDNGAYIAAQQPAYGAPAPNPFEVQDPFALTNSVAPHSAANNPFGPYEPTYPQQEQQPQLEVAPSAANPFGDFGEFPIVPVSEPQSTTSLGAFPVPVPEPSNITGFGEFPVVPVAEPENTSGLGALSAIPVSEASNTTGFGEFPVVEVSAPQNSTGFGAFPVNQVSEPPNTTGFGAFPVIPVSEPPKTTAFGEFPVIPVSEPLPVIPVSEPPKTTGFGEFPAIPVTEAQNTTTGFGGFPVNGGAHQQQHDSNNPFGSTGFL